MSTQLGHVVCNANLTIREHDVLNLVLEGKADKDISRTLGISIRTVRHHISNLFRKFGVGGRAELVSVILRLGRFSAQ
jgi:DNA-binding CsgD family transcriptional regulator